MNNGPSTLPNYAKLALDYASHLGSSPRGSATSAEKAAADYARSRLNDLGVKDVRIQSFLGLRSIWLFIALAFGLALVGHAAFWLLRRPLGDLIALLASVVFFSLSGYLLWRKFTFRDYILRSSLPHGPSQNVIAIMPPTGEVRQRLVLAAHLDSHRAVFWFASDLLVVSFSLLSIVSLYGVFAAILLYALAVITNLQVFAWVGLVLAFLHFVSWFTGVTADLGRYSPGANDNASSMGTVLALAERLKAQPLQATEVWLVFTGCEESGCDGVLALINEYGDRLKDAVFIDFDMVGIGDQLTYARAEGNLHRKSIPRELDTFLKDVGGAYGIESVSTPPGVFTEGGTFWEYGFKAACISTHRRGSPIAPEWHRLTDTPDKLQLSCLEMVQEFAWVFLQRFDQPRPRP